MKFKLGFVVSADVLRALLSKVEDFSIEEVVETPATDLTPPRNDTYVSGLTGRTYFKEQPRSHKPYKRQPTRPMDLNTGINRIVMQTLSDGMGHHTNEMQKHLAGGGYSANSICSRIQALQEKGVVEKLDLATYRLTDKYFPREKTDANLS